MYVQNDKPEFISAHPIECKHGQDYSVCVYTCVDSEDYVAFVREFDYTKQGDIQRWIVTSEYSDIERLMHNV